MCIGYGTTLHPGIRLLMKSAATSALGCPTSLGLREETQIKRQQTAILTYITYIETEKLLRTFGPEEKLSVEV